MFKFIWWLLTYDKSEIFFFFFRKKEKWPFEWQVRNLSTLTLEADIWMKWPFSVEMAWFPFVSSDFFPPFSVLSLSFMWVFAKFFLWSQTRQLKKKKKKKGNSLEALSQTVRSQFLDPLLVKYTHLIIEFKISFFSFLFSWSFTC